MIKEIVKNDKFMSFMVSGFSGFLIYISKKKIIFKTICKTAYGIILGLFTKTILENGTVNKSSLINIEELKDILFKIISATNPEGSNMTIKAALEGLKKKESVVDFIEPVKDIGKNIIETSSNMATANLLPIYGFGITWGLSMGGYMFKRIKVISPVFNEKMNGLSVIFNKVMNDEELAKNYLITRVLIGSNEALMSLGLYEWSVIIGIISITGLLSYITIKLMLKSKKDNEELIEEEGLVRQEIIKSF